MDYPKITPKAARVNAGLTQTVAAQLLNINVSTLQNYESGATVPPWNVVDEMSRIYKIGTDFLNFNLKTAFSG